MSLAIVETFPTLTEAQIACSALRAAGFDTEVFDESFGRVLSVDLVGGFRVMADEDEAEGAKALLRQIRGG